MPARLLGWERFEDEVQSYPDPQGNQTIQPYAARMLGFESPTNTHSARVVECCALGVCRPRHGCETEGQSIRTDEVEEEIPISH